MRGPLHAVRACVHRVAPASPLPWRVPSMLWGSFPTIFGCGSLFWVDSLESLLCFMSISWNNRATSFHLIKNLGNWLKNRVFQQLLVSLSSTVAMRVQWRTWISACLSAVRYFYSRNSAEVSTARISLSLWEREHCTLNTKHNLRVNLAEILLQCPQREFPLA